MPRNLRHFHLRDLGANKPYQSKGGGSGKGPSDVPDREGHAQNLLRALDALPNVKSDGLPGLYLEVSGRQGEKLKRDSLDTKHLSLLKYEEGKNRADGMDRATIFATAKGVEVFRKKVDQFRTENNPDREKDGQAIPGRPKNADLVQSVAAIIEAGLRALWRSPNHKFPAANTDALWEIWLNQMVLIVLLGWRQIMGSNREANNSDFLKMLSLLRAEPEMLLQPLSGR